MGKSFECIELDKIKKIVNKSSWGYQKNHEKVSFIVHKAFSLIFIFSLDSKLISISITIIIDRCNIQNSKNKCNQFSK